ncbi:MAG: DNA polymerase III subunit delta [Armatimonadetes bacterium]|nr:DNA polymerase III subunit delta [Armatimonadota bacterium]
MSFDLQKAISAPVVLIYGSEDYLRREALALISEAAELGPDDFDCEVVTGAQMPVQEWLGLASTVPFLATKRTVIVKDALSADLSSFSKDKNPLTGISEFSRIILVAQEDAGSTGSDRGRKAKSNLTLWQNWVKQAKGILIPCEVDEKDLIKLIRSQANQRGFSMSISASEMLIEMCGSNYSKALSELDKLVFYCTESKEIRESDVQLVVSASREWNIWTLMNAIRDKKISEALKQLRILIGSNKKLEDTAISQLLPAFSRHFRLLYQARYCLDHHIDPMRVPDNVSALMPEKNSLADQKEMVAKRIVAQARTLRMDQITNCLEEVARADARLKGCEPSASSLDTLEQLLFRISVRI